MRNYNSIGFHKYILARHGVKRFGLLLVLVLLVVFAPVSKVFAENNAQVKSELGDGYGRIVFTFDTKPAMPALQSPLLAN